MLNLRNRLLVAFLGQLSVTCGCRAPTLPAAAAPEAAAPLAAAPSAAGVSAKAPALTASVAPSIAAPPAAPWWHTPYPESFDPSRLSKQLLPVRVQGNQFVTGGGTPLIFQGVSIADPDLLVREGHWTRALFEAVAGWGANIVRLPVHPAAYRGLGHNEYLKLLDQAVIWATELDLYLIVDWHSIGNLSTGLFQHPMYDTSEQETNEFWRSVAFRYQGISTVALYELFNEPTTFNGKLGTESWEEWRSINEALIDIIYAHNKTAIPLVAGFDWAYDLAPIAKAPVRRNGVAYVSHPYPQKTSRPFEKKWDQSFGFAAAKYPLITTEIGYMAPDARGAHIPAEDDGSYGPFVTDYLAKRGASWVAWCFDPDWAPPLIADWNYTPTAAGAHFRKVMLGRQRAQALLSTPKH